VANHFNILNRIGEGAFSTVYRAVLKHYPEVGETFALKHITPTSHPSRIENELKCLLKIGGRDNVMGVKLCFRHRDHVVVVMPLFTHDKFQDILPLLTVHEMRDYMKALLVSLRRVHEFNVIHRDVKPSNFLYSRQRQEFSLVDFGLASGSILSGTLEGMKGQSSQPKPGARDGRLPLSPSKKATNKINIIRSAKHGSTLNKPSTSYQRSASYRRSAPLLTQSGLCDCFGKAQICHLCVARANQLAPRAGTAGFRSPEGLLKSPDQDTGVDVWSAGVMLLSMLSCRYPFFRAQDDMAYLAQILSLLGTDPCIRAARDLGKQLTVSEKIPSVDLRAACMRLRGSQMSKHSAAPEVAESWAAVDDRPFDLLAKLLDPNPRTRISAANALDHPFFDESGRS